MNPMNIPRSFIYCIILSFITTSLWGADDFEVLYQSMKARQPQLENYMMSPGTCLGERLDGLLEINFGCSEEVEELAKAENQDRKVLHKLMAEYLGSSEADIGKERAMRYQDRYPEGVLREIRLAATQTTWWDGVPPDPRKTAVSRILAVQYARLHEKPDASSPVVRDNLQQYEAFGVVDKAEGASGDIWFKVTEEYVPKVKPLNWSPKILGWIAEKDAIPWRRALVMRFTNAYQREPSVFFREPESILALIRQNPEQRKNSLQTILSEIKGGNTGANGVMAMEPLVGSGQERIIMYPVLDFYARESREDIRIDGMFVRLLEVAGQTRSGNTVADGQKELPIDILFVMDTTESMKPYLQIVLKAVEEFAGENNNSGIRFGFIGYQDKDPRFEYEVKSFSDSTQSASDFVRTLGGVSVQNTPVKGDDIPEAVFEGINAALESTQWRENAAKIIFLVGDAPGREDTLNIKDIRNKAFTRKISIFAFHIHNSKVSAGYDSQAKDQYRKLSSTYEGAYGTSREISHLLSIDARSADFRQIVADRFHEAQGSFKAILKAIDKSARTGEDLALPEVESGSVSELIFQQAMLLLPNASMPEKPISGWVCDKVLTNPGREALAPMILLSEAELDELAHRVRELKEIGESALRGEGGTTLDFFDLVAKNTRFTMVNPAAVNFRDAFSVPLGIDQLPYDSDIMATTREEFHNLDRVQEFVRSMSNKFRHYEDLRRRQGDAAIWKKLSMGAGEQDRIVGVELNQLP